MLFSSNTFLLLFLPAFLFIYYAGRNRTYRNIILLIFSLIFYAWGEPENIFLLITSIIINHFVGRIIEKTNNEIKRKAALVFGVCIDIFFLGIFKYAGFGVMAINQIFRLSLHIPNIQLPIGISFFTFQEISYIADIYRGVARAQRNLLGTALYVSMFPQLIAGPIVRYNSVARELVDRHENWNDFSRGIIRFVFGLSKKVLLANFLGELADFYFSGDLSKLSCLGAWEGAVAYTFQIYFDFSGYSDMAIGLGMMTGFHFNENFNYPYICSSIRDFWKRWHISLSTWFRDYVYIPLGGSRGGYWANIRNLFIVWFLTGLWHGADWNFIAWGLYYFLLLMLERVVFHKKIHESKWFKVIYKIFALICVITGWVIFHADGLSDGIRYIEMMYRNKSMSNAVDLFQLRNYAVILFMSVFFSTPGCKKLKVKIGKLKQGNIVLNIFEPLIILILWFLCVSCLTMNSYNPFIYFNF